MINTIVVEDSGIARAMWCVMVTEIAGISLAGEFTRASTAIAAIHREPPDVVLLDIQLGEGSGMEVMRVVTAEYPQTKIIVVSNYADPIYRNYYTEAGAFAFYDKSHELAAMRCAMQRLAGLRSAAGLSA